MERQAEGRLTVQFASDRTVRETVVQVTPVSGQIHSTNHSRTSHVEPPGLAEGLLHGAGGSSAERPVVADAEALQKRDVTDVKRLEIGGARGRGAIEEKEAREWAVGMNENSKDSATWLGWAFGAGAAVHGDPAEASSSAFSKQQALAASLGLGAGTGGAAASGTDLHDADLPWRLTVVSAFAALTGIVAYALVRRRAQTRKPFSQGGSGADVPFADRCIVEVDKRGSLGCLTFLSCTGGWHR